MLYILEDLLDIFINLIMSSGTGSFTESSNVVFNHDLKLAQKFR